MFKVLRELIKKLLLLFDNLIFVTKDQRNSIFCNLKLLIFH